MCCLSGLGMLVVVAVMVVVVVVVWFAGSESLIYNSWLAAS